MATRAVSIEIRRQVEEVFAYMNDVARETEWQPQLIEAEQIPPGPAAVGTRRRYVSEFMGKRVENVYVVKTYEPNRELVLETTPDSTLSATSRVAWTTIPGGTRVTMSVDGAPKGALRFLPRTLLESTFERELEAALARLKTLLEKGV